MASLCGAREGLPSGPGAVLGGQAASSRPSFLGQSGQEGFHFRRLRRDPLLSQTGDESIMSWFQKQLGWNTKHHGSSQGLQMPIGIPIALGVLALLALLALACNCLTEAWKSKWRPCCQRWWHLHPGNDQQLVSLKSPRMRGS
ncbi:PREDICTED: uncharacterized protein LOC106149311 isoform X2 [Chinchilla lanigera]|uniref:uncharacterized protein LOC106149311 isoform X2 n=1 Tax=Chinchilla lanigera TaxID=34839 RepID=UPI000696C2A3|nr:PREDICTED: uncharacterized protein LOC106149311 isoform X2 [Chinchilla lanigera]